MGKLKFKNKGIITIFMVCLVLGFFLIPTPITQAITRGYKTADLSLKPGIVVGLNQESQQGDPEVVKVGDEDASGAIGVVTNIKDSSVVIATPGQQVFVEDTGSVLAYVSDVNGAIRKGDKLTLSPLKGILSGVNQNSRVVFATALEDFPQKYQDYKIDDNGGRSTAKVALMRVNLDTKDVLAQTSSDTSTIKRVVKYVVGKDVSAVRVAIAFAVFLLVLFMVTGILYGAISSSITSLGRNPLAGKTVRRQLVHVFLIAGAIFIVGLGAMYLILWA